MTGTDALRSAEALIQRNHLLLADAAELRADVQRKLVQIRAQHRSQGERQRQWHKMQDLQDQAQRAKVDAAERCVVSQDIRAQVAAFLTGRRHEVHSDRGGPAD